EKPVNHRVNLYVAGFDPGDRRLKGLQLGYLASAHEIGVAQPIQLCQLAHGQVFAPVPPAGIPRESGIEASSSCVYGWAGARNSFSVSISSQTSPSFNTKARLATVLTRARSWLTKMVVVPKRAASSII